MKKGEKKWEKLKILEVIENNSSKSDFVKWFNTQYEKTITESSDWDTIEGEIIEDDKIDIADLKTYATSLASEEDIKNVLENTEEEVKKAEKTAQKLFYLSNFKQVGIAMGGALLLEGLLLCLAAWIVFSGMMTIADYASLKNFISFGLGFIGITNILGGLFLITE